MPVLESIKAKVGEAAYSRIDEVADKEVALALQMPLLDGDQKQRSCAQRTLLAHVSGFHSIGKGSHPQVFFDGLFAKVAPPFTAYFDDGNLIEKHQRLEPGQRKYDEAGANEFFCAPSFGFATSGSKDYCFW